MLAPVSASISTPVLCDTATSQRIASSVSEMNSADNAQRSIINGWQNGISSCVRLAASVPAMIAVSITGPFFARMPPSRRARAASGGKRTSAWAVALRAVTSLPPTSTIRGRLEESRWESFLAAIGMRESLGPGLRRDDDGDYPRLRKEVVSHRLYTFPRV